jgi:hypothetical protein
LSGIKLSIAIFAVKESGLGERAHAAPKDFEFRPLNVHPGEIHGVDAVLLGPVVERFGLNLKCTFDTDPGMYLKVAGRFLERAGLIPVTEGGVLALISAP